MVRVDEETAAKEERAPLFAEINDGVRLLLADVPLLLGLEKGLGAERDRDGLAIGVELGETGTYSDLAGVGEQVEVLAEVGVA